MNCSEARTNLKGQDLSGVKLTKAILRDANLDADTDSNGDAGFRRGTVARNVGTGY